MTVYLRGENPPTSTPQVGSHIPGFADFEEDEIRASLDAILATPAFARADRQSQFLRFICEAMLRGEGSKLNEYLIAYEVFGRGKDYSPGEDSVVRRQAHSLRQKLHDYYTRESPQSGIRIDIPNGRYVPVFSRIGQVPVSVLPVPNLAPVGLAPQQSAAKPSPLRPPRLNGFREWIAAIALAVLLIGVGYTIGTARVKRASPLSAIDPAFAEVWAPWLSDPSGAVICLSNPLTAVIKQFFFTLPLEPRLNPPRIILTSKQAEPLRNYFELPPAGHFYLYPALSQSKMGETLGVATLSVMLTRAGVPVQATQSRFLSWDNFRKQNLILLGHDEANRWLDPILDQLPIRMVTTGADKARHIAVSAGHGKNTQEFYLEPPASKHGVSGDYALVSMIGGIDEKHQLLLINGINTEGTQIAMEYLCDPKRLRELLTYLHRAKPSYRGPWRFQFVLHTEVRGQVPTTADLLVVKVL